MNGDRINNSQENNQTNGVFIESVIVPYFRNRWQNIFESGPIKLRLLSWIFHVDDVEELERVHSRIALCT